MHKFGLTLAVVAVALGVSAHHARFRVQVLEKETEKPMQGVAVRAIFCNDAGTPDTVKYGETDAAGLCSFKGMSRMDKVVVSSEAPDRYRDYAFLKVEGVDKDSGRILPDNQVLTLYLDRIGRRVSLNHYHVYGVLGDAGFDKGVDRLQYDMLVGDYLPPQGTGTVADVEFVRHEREDLGPAQSTNDLFYTGRAYKDHMTVRFLGDGNGAITLTPSKGAFVHLHMAPTNGYEQVLDCWEGKDRYMQEIQSWNRPGVVVCFRIRTKRDENGGFKGGYYGFLREGFGLRGGYIDAEHTAPGIEAPVFMYFLNPTEGDMNLEKDSNWLRKPGSRFGG